MGVGVWIPFSQLLLFTHTHLAIMVQFIGTYKRTEEEKYEAFLNKLNVGLLKRKAALASTPSMEISESGGKYKMVTSTTLSSVELNFELGVEFDETTADGRTCKTTVTKEGDNKLVTKQVAQKEGEKNVTVVREFSDEGINVEFICGDVVSKQFFKRQ